MVNLFPRALKKQGFLQAIRNDIFIFKKCQNKIMSRGTKLEIHFHNGGIRSSVDLLALQSNNHSLQSLFKKINKVKKPFKISEIVLRAFMKKIYSRKLFIQENLLNLTKNSENLWHLGHDSLPPPLHTHSSMWWKLHSGQLTPKQWDSSTTSPQSRATISPWRGKLPVFLIPPHTQLHVAEVKFQVSTAERLGSPFTYPALTGRWTLEARNSRQRILVLQSPSLQKTHGAEVPCQMRQAKKTRGYCPCLARYS